MTSPAAGSLHSGTTNTADNPDPAPGSNGLRTAHTTEKSLNSPPASIPRPRRAEQLSFAAIRETVGCSRLYARYVLGQWRIPAEHMQTALLLVSELVTNAVCAGETPQRHPTHGDRPGSDSAITVRLLLYLGGIVIEVWDESPQSPVLKDQDLDAESGRGLFLVESLSARWSYYYPQRGGKVVWCEIDIRDHELAGPLPKRLLDSMPLRTIRFANDPVILRRLLEGLLALDSDD